MFRKPGLFSCIVVLSYSLVQVCTAQSGEWAKEGVNNNLTPPPTVYQNCTFAGDNDLAVSDDRIVLVSNCRVKITDKAGNMVAEALLRDGTEFDPAYEGLFIPVIGGAGQNAGNRVFDPRVHYDPFAERFWIVAVEQLSPFAQEPLFFDKTWLRVAVSKDATPNNLSADPMNGDWHEFTFDLKSSQDTQAPLFGFADRPTINTDDAWLYVAIGRDAQCSGALCQPHLVQAQPPEHRTVLVAMPKGDAQSGMLAGQYPPLPVWSARIEPPSDPGEASGWYCAAREYEGNPEPQYFLSTRSHPFLASYFETHLRVHALVPAGATWDTHSIDVELPLAAQFWTAPGAPPNVPGMSVFVNPNVFHSVKLRNGSLWATQHVRRTQSAGVKVQWYEIAMNGWPDGGTPQVMRWGEIDPDPSGTFGYGAYDPSIAVNVFGDVAITYTIAGGGLLPQYWRAFFPVSIPSEIAPRAMRVSLLEYNQSPMAADYSGTEPDPLDQCVFYGHAMLVSDIPVPGMPTKSDFWQSWLGRYELCSGADVADYSGDGIRTGADVLMFQAIYQYGLPTADFTGDGVLDVHDHAALEATIAHTGK